MASIRAQSASAEDRSALDAILVQARTVQDTEVEILALDVIARMSAQESAVDQVSECWMSPMAALATTRPRSTRSTASMRTMPAGSCQVRRRVIRSSGETTLFTSRMVSSSCAGQGLA